MINKAFIYPAIGLVAAAMAAFQIYIIRFFSLTHLGTYIYIPISVSILGLGLAGTIISFFEERMKKNADMYLGLSLVLTIFFTSTIFLALKQLEFNMMDVLTFTNFFHELVRILVFYVILTIPFLFAGFFIVLSFYTEKNPIHTIYVFKLAGASIGAILFLIGVVILPIKYLIFISVILLSISAFFIISKEKKHKIILLVITLVSLGAPFLDIENTSMPYKDISKSLALGGKTIAEMESPFGDLKVLEKSSKTFSNGISSTYTGKYPDFKGIYIDGNKTSDFVKGDNQDFLKFTPFSVVYSLKTNAATLILESGGGLAVMSAIYFNAKKIDAVEKNYQIIDLLKENFSEYTAGIYHNKNVTFYRSESRPYIASTNKKYDLIYINGNSIMEGGFKEDPNYLLTREALERASQLLFSDGILMISLDNQNPPRIEYKVIHSLVKQLQKGKNLYVFKTPDSFVVMVKQNGFAEQEVKLLNEKNQSLNYPVVYPSKNLQDPYVKNIDAILQGNKDFIAEYPYSLSPFTDSNPYLFFTQKINTIFSSKNDSSESSNYAIIWISFILTLLIGLITLYLPLFMKKDYSKKIHISKAVMYFGGVGAGFILVQMILIQKFNLLFSSSVISVAVILASTFFFGGIGSYVGGLFKKKVFGLFISIPSILILILIYVLFFDYVLEGIANYKLLTRIVFGFLAVSPLAFFMGMPFSLGMEWIKYFDPKVIPWCWSINASFSVVAAVLSLILSIEIGLTWTLLIAFVFYAMAFGSFIWMDFYYQQTSYLYRRYKV